ncbi:MAG: hypothetical protein COC16_04480 [Lutibacter sp.]|nr:MAG: hypothetical protein COC16_04480 [Lutibacter sp.]
MERLQANNYLNELIEVFLHNFIYYIPSEIIYDGVLEQLEGQLEDDFFDELSFLDIHEGIAQITNEDAFELNSLLFDKRSSLEKNIFALLEIKLEMEARVFQFVIEKYLNQLIFYLFITEWLTLNLKNYNKDDIHISIIGAFKIQHENFNVHLKDFYNSFEALIDINLQPDFSTQKLVAEYFLDLISRYNQSKIKTIEKNTSDINPEINDNQPLEENQQPEKRTSKKKIQRPHIIDTEIENMILEGVFKVKMSNQTI